MGSMSVWVGVSHLAIKGNRRLTGGLSDLKFKPTSTAYGLGFEALQNQEVHCGTSGPIKN